MLFWSPSPPCAKLPGRQGPLLVPSSWLCSIFNSLSWHSLSLRYCGHHCGPSIPSLSSLLIPPGADVWLQHLASGLEGENWHVKSNHSSACMLDSSMEWPWKAHKEEEITAYFPNEPRICELGFKVCKTFCLPTILFGHVFHASASKSTYLGLLLVTTLGCCASMDMILGLSAPWFPKALFQKSLRSWNIDQVTDDTVQVFSTKLWRTWLGAR